MPFPVERSELRLIWPPGLFVAEARALLAAGADDDALGGLLAEAFHGDRGEKLARDRSDGRHRLDHGPKCLVRRRPQVRTIDA